MKFLDTSAHTNFIILFKGVLGRCDYKALYQHDVDGEVRKIFGAQTAPDTILSEMVEHFFKYNNSGKEFISLESKSFNQITDAVALKKEYA